MEEIIVDYLMTRLSIKGDYLVFFDGKKIYHDELVEHIVKVFLYMEYLAMGYIYATIFDINPDFSNDFWYYEERPNRWYDVKEFSNQYVLGVDTANVDSVSFTSRIVVSYVDGERYVYEYLNQN